MTMTRDQLRAARVLLHLHQEDLARESSVSIVTIRRFELGYAIRGSTLDALKKAVERAGAVLITGNANPKGERIGAGVALRPEADLPAETAKRIRDAAERLTGSVGREGGGEAAGIGARPAKRKRPAPLPPSLGEDGETLIRRPRGRPRKVVAISDAD